MDRGGRGGESEKDAETVQSQLRDSDRQSASKRITPGGQEKEYRPYLAQSPALFGGGSRRAYSASVCPLTNNLLKRAEISLSPPPLWKVNKFGRRSNKPMNVRGFLQLALADWPVFVVRPSLSPSAPTPSHARWRRPAEWRPHLGLAEVDSLSTSPLGAEPREPRGRGPGGDRGTCVAGPRARAQPTPPPPGPGPVQSHPFLVCSPSDSLPVVVHHHQAPKAEVSPPARAHLHFRDVWPLLSQTARLQNRDYWTSTWPPFLPLSRHLPLTYFLRFLILSLDWRLLMPLSK